MNTRTLFAALAATCLAMLQGCNMSSTTTPSSTENTTTNSTTANIAFRLPASITEDPAYKGGTICVGIIPDNPYDYPEYSKYLNQSPLTECRGTSNPSDPAYADNWIMYDVPVGMVRIYAYMQDSLGFNYMGASDSLNVRPYILNRIDLLLKHNYTTTGFVEFGIQIDTSTASEPMIPVIKCRNSNELGYCLDLKLQDPTFVGPWNCKSWSLVNGKRSCNEPLPAVEAPASDTFCDLRYEGSPMLCLQHDPFIPKKKIYPIDSATTPDSIPAWMPVKIDSKSSQTPVK